jgi:dUTP pyrophosphatase
MSVTIHFKRLPHGHNLELPSRQTSQAAGYDLSAALPEQEPVMLKPMERQLIPTGFAMALPEGYEAQIRPRSGLAYKHGISVLNAPGTIDSDYRGEIKILLINWGDADFTITRGMRIAQMIIAPVAQTVLEEVDALEATQRNDGGFGSTGLSRAP